MSVRLYQLVTVVVGKFNPHIITPDWLKKEAIAESDSAELLFGVSGREVTFRFKTGRLEWQVDYNRLTITSDDVSQNTARKAAEVIEKLPHTPLSALGNNFHFEGDSSHWGAGLPSLGKKCDFKSLTAQGKVLEVAWSCKVEKQGFLLGVSVEQKEDIIRVHMNIHRPISSKDEAIDAANQFATDLKTSKEFLQDVIGETVEK